MTYPSIRSSATGSDSTDTTPDVTLPATISAGDLLLLVGSLSGSVTITAPSGWSTLSNTGQHFAFYKIAVGSEDSTVITFTLSSGQSASWIVYSIQDWVDTPAIGTWTSGINPPSLTSGFGAVETLWIAFARDQVYNFTAAPSGYSGLINYSSTITVGSAYKQSTASSEDPGVFTESGNGFVRYSNTIAIKGVSANNALFFGGDF